MSLPLAGLVPEVLQDALGHMDESKSAAFIEHLLGGTSAEFLANWSRRNGTPIGATSLKSYRRLLKDQGVC